MRSERQATPASAKVSDPKQFRTSELVASFLCLDSKGEHDTGAAVPWQNRITIKSRTYQSGADKMMELRTAPAAPLRYTTDGSDPNLWCHLRRTVCRAARHPRGARGGGKTRHCLGLHRLNINWDGGARGRSRSISRNIWKREHAPKTTQET